MADEPRRQHRDYLARLHIEMGRDYDKLVTTLAAGGIGLALALVRETDLTQRPEYALHAAFIFGLSLFGTLVSLLTSQRATETMVDQMDRGIRSDQLSETWGVVTESLNLFAGACLLGGIIVLTRYVEANLGG